jgi:phosphoribosylformimino-5-aminoimidazole carboxamide ribotide isomerase
VVAVKVWPAIDLMGGRVVRLVEGKRDRATFYDGAPDEVARGFFALGASRLHVVDLDAAFDAHRGADATGGAANRRAVRAILEEAARAGVEVQVGGGLRSVAAIEALVELGARRVVLGTVAIEEPAVLVVAAARYPGKIVVAVDARDGIVATRGWTQDSGRRAIDVATDAARVGAAAILYTDIALDGTGKGPNVEATRRLQAELSIPVIASGGVGSLAHLHALRAAEVREVVVGKALHDGRIALADALAP